MPPPQSSYSETIVAQNPFDDIGLHPSAPMQIPPSNYGPRPGPYGQNMGGYNMHGKPGHPQGMVQTGPPGSSKIYPPNQPMVFNPSNPNAPPIYPCGICHKEVHDNDEAILCESGCNFWFHRICTGLSEGAYQMLRHEVYAEWVCDRCLSSKSIPLVKMKP